MSYQPPRILESICAELQLESIHLALGRTLSQNDWPEKTWKLSASPWDPGLWTARQGRPLGSLLRLLSTQGSLPNRVPCFAILCDSSDDSCPSARPEPPLGSWKGSPHNSAAQVFPPPLRPLQDPQGAAVSLETNVTHAALKICFIHRGQCYNCSMDSSEELKKSRFPELNPNEQHLIYWSQSLQSLNCI